MTNEDREYLTDEVRGVLNDWCDGTFNDSGEMLAKRIVKAIEDNFLVVPRLPVREVHGENTDL